MIATFTGGGDKKKNIRLSYCMPSKFEAKLGLTSLPSQCFKGIFNVKEL